MDEKVELLLTITGEDQPGITADICYELSKANADLLDIQQVTISPLLVMALHVGLPIPPGETATEPAAFVPGELLRLALRRNLQLRVQPFIPFPEPKSPDLYYAVTCLAPSIRPAALNRISSTLAHYGANIDRITRLTEDSLKCLELTVRASSGTRPYCPQTCSFRSLKRSWRGYCHPA